MSGHLGIRVIGTLLVGGSFGAVAGAVFGEWGIVVGAAFGIGFGMIAGDM